MERKVYFSKCVSSTIEKLKAEGKEAAGLIIGKGCKNFDVAVKLLVTPIPDQKIEKWLVAHSQEIMSVLPGGLFIIGAFAMSKTAKFANGIKQVLTSYYEYLNSLDVFIYIKPVMFESSSFLSILNLDMDGKLRSMKQVNPNNKFADSSAKWEQKKLPSSWKTITSNMQVNFELHYEDNVSLLDVQEHMKSHYARIFDSVATLEPSGEDDQAFNCQLFLKSNKVDDSKTEVDMHRSTGKVTIRGVMHLFAIVLSDASDESTINAIKLDAIQSLYQRVNILQSSQESPLELHKEDVVHLPKRVLYAEDETSTPSLRWFDYSSSFEEPADSLERIKENLNADIEVERLNDRIEVFYTDVQQETDEDSNDKDVQQELKDVAILLLAVTCISYCAYYFFNKLTYQSRHPNHYGTLSTGAIKIITESSTYLGVVFAVVSALTALHLGLKVYRWSRRSGDEQPKEKTN